MYKFKARFDDFLVGVIYYEFVTNSFCTSQFFNIPGHGPVGSHKEGTRSLNDSLGLTYNELESIECDGFDLRCNYKLSTFF